MTPADAAFKLSLDELEGVDELSVRVFRAFLNALRLHRQLMIATLYRTRHPPRSGHLPAPAVGQRRHHAARSGRRAALVAAHREQDAAGHGESRRDRAPSRSDRPAPDARAPHAAGRELETGLRAVSAALINETIGTLPGADRAELERLLNAFTAASPRRSTRSARARRAAQTADGGPALGARQAGTGVSRLLRERLAPIAPDHAHHLCAPVRADDHQPLAAHDQRRHHQQRRGHGRRALHRAHGRLHADLELGPCCRHDRRCLLWLKDGHGFRPRRARRRYSARSKASRSGRAQPIRHRPH